MKKPAQKPFSLLIFLSHIYKNFSVLLLLCIIVGGTFIYSFSQPRANTESIKTATYSIISVDDIANQEGSTVVLPLEKNLNPWIGNAGKTTETMAGFRFHGAALPKGTIVHSANLEVSPDKNSWIGLSMEITAENTFSPKPFTVGNGPLGRKGTVKNAQYQKDEEWLKDRFYSINATLPIADLVTNTGTDGVILLRLLGTGQPWARKSLVAGNANAFSPRLTIVYELSSEGDSFVSEETIPKEFAVPGTIEAANFLAGGEGVSYHDTESENKGVFYRNTGVDVKISSSGTPVIGWGRSGEWITYKLRVAESGNYTVTFLGGATSSDRTLELHIDGVSTGTLRVPTIPDWNSYQSITSDAFPLTAGTHTFKVTVGPNDYVDLAAFTFTKQGTVIPTSVPKPTSIQPTGGQTTTPQKTIYVSPSGMDSNDGTQTRPVKSIKQAVSKAVAMPTIPVTILLSPGIYREQVSLKGIKRSSTTAITLQGAGVDTIITGAEPAKNLSWTKTTDALRFPRSATSNIYRADISGWGKIPELALNGSTRLPKAHEPDFSVTTAWKYHENYWKAEGVGDSPLQSLKDNLTDPAGSYPDAQREAGNLTSINGFTGSFLTGARIFVKDTYSGHDEYTVSITGHDGVNGIINFDRPLKYYSGSSLVGPYSKYIIEGKPELLDREGEWYVDPNTKRLYMWAPGGNSPQNSTIEFAVREQGIAITNSSFLTVKNITIRNVNWHYGNNYDSEGALVMANSNAEDSDNITIDAVHMNHTGVGIRMLQGTTEGKTTHHVTIKNSNVGPTDGYGFVLFDWPHTEDADSGVHHLYIQNNNFHDSGFRPSGGGIAMFFQQAKNVLFEKNMVARSAHNAIDMHSTKQTNVLVRNNIFEDNCLNGLDCGGFKLWSSGGSMNNVLVMNNIVRRTRGFSTVMAQQDKWDSRMGKGYGGFGFYTDILKSPTPSTSYAAYFFRNLSYDNSANGIHLTRSSDIFVSQNLLYGNTTGVSLSNSGKADTVFSRIVIDNNLIAPPVTLSGSTDINGIYIPQNSNQRNLLRVDKNSYAFPLNGGYKMQITEANGSGRQKLTSVSQIRQAVPIWEMNGKDSSVFTLPNPSSYSFSLDSIPQMKIITNAGIPPEIQTVKRILEQSLGVTISDSLIVGTPSFPSNPL